MSDIVDRIECLECGDVFERPRKRGGPLPLYCSACKKERARARTREHARRKREAERAGRIAKGDRVVGATETLTCRACGKPFEAEIKMGAPPKNCPACRPELERRRRKQWADTHPDKQAESQRAWREANPDKVREMSREWHRANPDKARDKKRRYREADIDRVRRLEREANARRDPMDKARIKRRYNLARFGLTEEDFIDVLAEQGGGCAICGTTAPGGRTGNWHMDHDHACLECGGGKGCPKCFRALLCSNCNIGIGNMRDDPEIMRAAAAYVERWRTRET